MSEPVIEVRGLSHRYDVEPVLRNIDLTIEKAEIFGFLGHNGAGKTTAINILTTLITPTSGTARGRRMEQANGQPQATGSAPCRKERACDHECRYR